MSLNALCSSIGDSLPSLFKCGPAAGGGVRVRTPLMYPDGGVVDVFVLERDGGFTISDYGESLGWLRLQSVSRRRSPKQNRMIGDVCQTLGLELERGQLVLRVAAGAVLGESVLRLAQGAVRLSDLWFTLRTRAAESAADEVHEWLAERHIVHERGVRRTGRSGREWTVDFQTRTDQRTSIVFLLSTGSRSAARRITEPVVAGCVDLSHLRETHPQLTLVSLFDDTQDLWRSEDFQLLEQQSEVALWSSPERFERLLLAA